jgi:hypothetical protein
VGIAHTAEHAQTGGRNASVGPSGRGRVGEVAMHMHLPWLCLCCCCCCCSRTSHMPSLGANQTETVAAEPQFHSSPNGHRFQAHRKLTASTIASKPFSAWELAKSVRKLRDEARDMKRGGNGPLPTRWIRPPPPTEPKTTKRQKYKENSDLSRRQGVFPSLPGPGSGWRPGRKRPLPLWQYAHLPSRAAAATRPGVAERAEAGVSS